jgi:hypothetical protein
MPAVNGRAAASERINDCIKRLRVEVKQVVEPADFRVAEVVRAGSLLLLFPHVVNRQVEICGMVGGCLLSFSQNGRFAVWNTFGDFALCYPNSVRNLRLRVTRHPHVEYPAVTLSDLDRELAEIDENLIRNELTMLEECEQLARRKEIYEIKHPQTKAKVAGANGSNRKQGNYSNANATVAFASDTAKKTGKSKRTVENKASIGKKLKKKAAQIKGTAIEDSQKDLLMLANMDDQKQDAIIEKIASGEAENVTAAARLIKAAAALVPVMAAWLNGFPVNRYGEIAARARTT